jgi:arylsulfatase A-like enzyme
MKAPQQDLTTTDAGSRLGAFLALAALWCGTLFLYCTLKLPQQPPTWGSWLALALALLFLALAAGTLATLLSSLAERLLRARRWPRGFDLLQSAALGLAAGWGMLSLVKFRATREHLSLDDVRFLLSSLRQVGAEATREERLLLAVALGVPVAVAAIAFAAFHLRRLRPDSTGASTGSTLALLGVALAGLLTLAWRQPYARFVLSEVVPETSWIARQFTGARTLGGAPDRAFVPDPARHRRIVPYIAPAEFARPNVLVVMLESIPWARLFGPLARPESTPRLLTFAGESVNFSRAYATATHSDYAQTSILASLHPRKFEQHDYFTDLTYPRTLFWDLFQPLGYRTALFSCQNEGWGNMAAFLRTPALETFRHSPDWPSAPRRGDGSESKVFESTPVSAFLAWVDAAPARPFAAYLNFQATHYPYVVPPGEPEPFAPSAIDFPTTFLSYPLDKIPVMENRFHNALAYVDRQFGRLIDGLATSGVLENTVFVVVSDHGEAFYEHGIPTHGTTLHEEQLRTAMFIRVPGLAPRTVEAPVSVLDAVPSIVAALGLPEHGNFQGRSDVLSPSYDGQIAAARGLPFTIQGMTREDGILLGDWKLIVNWSRGERALFDLARDPDERANLAAANPARVADLDRELARLALEQLAYYRDRGWERGYYPPRLP